MASMCSSCRQAMITAAVAHWICCILFDNLKDSVLIFVFGID